MPDKPAHIHGVMEGKGAYNKHAKLQAGGGTLALPLLEQAVENMALDSGDQPIFIADYGSSQGKNSLAPMGLAIRTLRRRLGPDRPVFVFHVDLPPNDFSALFQVVDSDPNTYVLNEPNVFPCAIGRSFYRNVLPPQSVHLAWSSYAVIWLSRIPARIPGHFVVIRSTGSVRAAFERQAAQDWETFLALRANELRPGGRMVVVLPVVDDDGRAGLEALFDHANEVFSDMVDEGTLATEERERMVLGLYPRRGSDILAPFQRARQFHGLTVEACNLSMVADTAWADYELDGNREALAGRHAMFFRSTFLPSLANALTRSEDAEHCSTFGDRLETGLRQRLADQPAPVHSFVGAIVLAKQGNS